MAINLQTTKKFIKSQSVRQPAKFKGTTETQTFLTHDMLDLKMKPTERNAEISSYGLDHMTRDSLSQVYSGLKKLSK